MSDPVLLEREIAKVRRDVQRLLDNAATTRQIEHYARCTVQINGLTVEPGVELREGDDFVTLQDDLREFARWVGSLSVLFTASRLELLRTMEDAAGKRWPGRAWFVEIFDESGNWSQSYMPHGMPRSR